MDVCTLIVPTIFYALGCLPQQKQVCVEEDGVKWCRSEYVGACTPQPSSHWSCKRDDGTEYRLNEDKK
jgi:peptide methionine sulfoxide reductase MsrA